MIRLIIRFLNFSRKAKINKRIESKEKSGASRRKVKIEYSRIILGKNEIYDDNLVCIYGFVEHV